MATHSVTVQLSDSAFRSLKRKVESGKYATVDDVFEEALVDLDFSAASQGYEPWSRDEAIAAYDEHMANPSEVYTSEQVLAYLAEERASDSAAI